jgi:rubrerythrin
MIENVTQFLQHAIQLETEAAESYERLAQMMRERDRPELAALFDRFGEFSRLHLGEATARLEQVLAGLPRPAMPGGFQWPDGVSPENPLAALDRRDLDVGKALNLALALERQACDFYSVVAGQTHSEQVQELAQAFAEEEAEHVSHLERWIERQRQ